MRSLHDLARVIDYLEQIKDPRQTEYGNIRHKLIDSIVIAFTVALYENYEEIEEWGRLKQDFLKSFLEFPNRVILYGEKCTRPPILSSATRKIR